MTETIADTALNGAQVKSLLEIVASVGRGEITEDAAVVLMGSAFPRITEQEARVMLRGATAPPEVANPPPVA